MCKNSTSAWLNGNYEIVSEFSNYRGKNATTRNTGGFAPDTDYLHTDKFMRFVVGGDSVSDKSDVPSALARQCPTCTCFTATT
ncbi:hypothetical protein CTA1_7519 [Colletotrichum tanaceti]|uniref:Uncharacterized protein n=1 Tax=Colletotrichum tanaceti TaxID=1306861 RepID=A0A4U6XBV7_9PEZI|nr:hypothetical protein CTA1_7519 [Colletotrichum tanaceti]